MTPYQLQSPPAARSLVNERWRDYFAGCGYLGLQAHPALAEAAIAAISRYGLTTATSRGGFGEHPLYRAVEEAAARFFASERSLYFSSGYLGATLLLQGLRGAYDRMFIDDEAHFSIWDAVRAANTSLVAFRHLQADDLALQLRAHLRPKERPLVISDGVFPISGEIAPAPDYARALCSYPGALLCLDDAHAVGVLGAHGRGTMEHYSALAAIPDAAAPRVFAASTLSKALAGYGGLLSSDAAFIEHVARHAPVFVAATPPPLPAAAATVVALELARSEPERRQRLYANVARARAGLRELGWPLAETPVPILCLGARPGLDLARLQAELFAQDICVSHVSAYSSAPAGGALRIAMFATHTTEQIDRLVAVFGSLL